MSSEQNRKNVQMAYEGFNRGDLDAVLDALTDDVVWSDRSLQVSPLSGVYYGKSGVMDFFSKLLSLVEFPRFDVSQILADEDTVVVLVDATTTVKETGKTVDQTLVHVLGFRGEKASTFDLYEDDSRSPWV
jgi:ketosteroid isomerase-like protein